MVKLWGETKISRLRADQNIVRNKIICDMFCPLSSTYIAQYQEHIAFYVGLDHQDNTAAYKILNIATTEQQHWSVEQLQCNQ
jgi:hypothetical protein